MPSRSRFLSYGVNEFDLGSEFQYRILSSNPAADSDWTPVRFRYPARLQSVTATPGAVNPDEGTPVEFAASGSPPLTLTFADSSRLALSPQYSSEISFRRTIPMFSERSQTFRVVGVRNECGPGTGTGQFDVTVNPFSLRITSLSPANLCAGSTLTLSYSRQGGDFQSGNRFRVLLTPLSPGSGFPRPAELTLDATEEGGLVRAGLPKNAVFDEGRPYLVRLLATQPEVISPPADGGSVRLWPEASAELTTPSTTLNYAAGVGLSVRFRGAPPFRAELTDGVVMATSDPFASPPLTAFVSVTPPRTTEYRILSFVSGCGEPAKPGQNVTRVDVLPGMVLDSLPVANERSACEGQPITGRLRTNLALSAGTSVTVFLRQYRLVNGSYGPVVWSVPGQLNGNRLTFTAPTVGPIDVSSTSGSTTYDIWVQTQNPAFTSSVGTVSIRSQPTLVLRSSGTTGSDRVLLNFVGGGGGPFDLLFDDGATYTIFDSQSLELPFLENVTYRVRRVSNACGSTDTDISRTFTGPTTTGVVLQPVRLPVCRGDSLLVQYKVSGAYNGGNQFRLQVSREYGDWVNVATLPGGTGRWALLPDAGNYSVRIASTDPLVYSTSLSFRVADKPSVRVFASGSSTPPVVGDFVSLPVEITGVGPFTTVVTDGTRDWVFPNSYGSPSFQPDRGGTYRLKSVANACGAATVPPNASRSVDPLRLSVTMQREWVCQGGTVAVAYSVQGQVSLATRYRLQVLAENDTSRVLATLGETDGFLLRGSLPATLAAGRYSVRVVTTNPSAASRLMNLLVSSLPTAVLSAEDGGSTITTTGDARLKLTLTGGHSYTLLFSDNELFFAKDSPALRFVSPQRSTTYSLRTVYNVCGYGPVAGQVSVRVTPTMQVNRSSFESLCPGQSLRLRVDTRGDFEAGNTFRFDLLDGPRVVARLDSNRAAPGEWVVALPAGLRGGNYQLRVTSSRPVLTQSVNLFVNVPPVVRLSGSGATVNPGQTAYLRLDHLNRAGGSFSAIRYTLSGGVSGTWEPFQGPVFSVAVSPTVTTTYALTSISNECGTGTASGSATVTVNPPADRTVNMPMPQVFDNRLCLGDTVQVSFEARGAFSPGNRFTVQLSDSTGANFANVTTLGTANPLRAVVPTGTPGGAGYRLRVVASDAGTQSGSSPFAYSVWQRASAVFDTDVLNFLPGGAVRMLIRFTGDGPWTYTIASTAGNFSRLTGRNPDTLAIQPTLPSLSYRLTGVSNVCGNGTVGSPGTLRIELITALEPTAAPLRVFPNPTADRLCLEGFTAPTHVRLLTSTGTLLQRMRSAGEALGVDVSPLPAGVYLLRVDHATGPVTYRVLKE